MKNKIKKIIELLKTERVVPIIKTTQLSELLSGKTALITGGSGGIGFAIADKFIQSGAKVIITGTNEEKLKKNKKKLGDNAEYILIDLKDISCMKKKIEETISIYGKIDILVNCAGVHTSRDNFDFLNITEKEYDDIMNLNIKSVYFLSQIVANYMINEKIHGNILNISSQSALEPAWSPYRLSKWSIKGLTEGLAQSLIRFGIVVNGIGPGPTATSMQDYNESDGIYTNQNPIRRYTMPEEVAEYALMLVSDLGRTVIGDTIYMSGGRGIIELR